MSNFAYIPPWWLKNGLLMTVYTALFASQQWEQTTVHPEPPYKEKVFIGAKVYQFLAFLPFLKIRAVRLLGRMELPDR